MIGRVTNVSEDTAGSELAADAAATDTSITVRDAADFNWEDGGSLVVGAETFTYTVDPDTELLTLGAALANDYSEDEQVLVEPRTVERVASVIVEGQGEELVVRVPHSLYHRLDLGTRDGDEQEAVTVDADDEGRPYVLDLLGQEPTPISGSEFGAGVEIEPGTMFYTAEEGARMEMDNLGIRAYNVDELLTFYLSSLTGDVTVKGLFDFGSGSRLTLDDLIELKQQESAGTYQTPVLQQSARTGPRSANTSHVLTLPAATAAGNQLIAFVTTYSASATHTTPSGWTKVDDVSTGSKRISCFRREGSSGVNSITAAWSALSEYDVLLMEWSGLVVGAHDEYKEATGTGNPAATGSTPGSIDQDVELVLAAFVDGFVVGWGVPSGYAQVHASGEADYADFFSKVTSSIATQSASSSGVATPGAWAAMLVTFKAKAIGSVATPEAGKLRHFVKEVGGAPVPHVIDDDAQEYALLGLLSSLGRRKVVIGSDSVTGDGDSNVTDTITHDVGRTPIFAVAVMGPSNVRRDILPMIDAWTTTQVTFNFNRPDGAAWSSTIPYVWLVIG